MRFIGFGDSAACPNMVQTLSRIININNICRNETALEMNITDQIKTSGKNSVQPTLFLPIYQEDIRICPVTALLAYLERTRDLRKEETNLFITFKKPYRKASSQTISIWLKSVLQSSGLNTEKFTGHSTRHAATSAAARKGVSIDRIRLTAGWTAKSNMFTKVYNRPLIPQNNFAEKVLEI